MVILGVLALGCAVGCLAGRIVRVMAGEHLLYNLVMGVLCAGGCALLAAVLSRAEVGHIRDVFAITVVALAVVVIRAMGPYLGLSYPVVSLAGIGGALALKATTAFAVGTTAVR